MNNQMMKNIKKGPSSFWGKVLCIFFSLVAQHGFGITSKENIEDYTEVNNDVIITSTSSGIHIQNGAIIYKSSDVTIVYLHENSIQKTYKNKSVANKKKLSPIFTKKKDIHKKTIKVTPKKTSFFVKSTTEGSDSLSNYSASAKFTIMPVTNLVMKCIQETAQYQITARICCILILLTTIYTKKYTSFFLKGQLFQRPPPISFA